MIILSEHDVTGLLSTSDAVALLETALHELHTGQAQNAARTRIGHDRYTLHVLPAAASGPYLGAKIYQTGLATTQFIYVLFGANGLEALIAADRLGRFRTGAAAGLATKYLAPADVARLTVFGAGNQAWTQIEAMHAVRNLREVTVVNRSGEHAEALAARVRSELGLAARTSADTKSAVRDADIVCTATSSKEPLFNGADLPERMHINAVGSNRATHREIDGLTLHRASAIVVEDVEQARREAGDLLLAENFDWQRLRPMETLLEPAAPYEGITVFESLGIGLWDLALARELLARAEMRGVGSRMSLESFF